LASHSPEPVAPQPEDPARQRKSALSKAFTLLKHRDRAVAEMRRRLAERFDAEVVELVVAELCEQGYLNDQNLAERLVEGAIKRRHHGPQRIRNDLYRLGIDPDDYRQAMDTFCTPEQVEAAALAASRAHFRGKKPDSDEGSRRRLAGYLGRRGFPEAVIHAMVRRIRQGDLWDHPE